MFGDNHLAMVEDGNYEVLSRFTRCQDKLDRHIKTILNLSMSRNMMHFVNPHYVDGSLAYNAIVDLDKRKFIHGPWNYGCTSETAQLNHYNSKTFPEFMEKMKRGKADTMKSHPGYNYLSSDFNKHNFNDIEDMTARDFMYRS